MIGQLNIFIFVVANDCRCELASRFEVYFKWNAISIVWSNVALRSMEKYLVRRLLDTRDSMDSLRQAHEASGLVHVSSIKQVT